MKPKTNHLCHLQKESQLAKPLLRIRSSSGASLALVAVCAFVLVLFMVFCFRLIMYLGGVQELNNTADAAALNVAKRAMDVRTSPSVTDYGYIYNDCCDSQGLIGLHNINRVWGKAYMINANVEEMTANQQNSNAATDAANNAFVAAQAINDDLYAQVKDKVTLGSFFDQIAGVRLHRMLGNPTYNSDANSKWPTALTDRGDQSNLAANSNQIPGPAQARFNSVPAAGSNYLRGYVPMQANNKNFYFIAFHSGEMTHLITNSYFERNRQDKLSIPDINNPLPNAFSGQGTTQDSMGSQSFAAANPQRQYQLAMPRSFVAISLINLAYWNVQGKQVKITTYGFTPETQFGAQQISLGVPNNYLDGYASLGNEFQGDNTLWTAITSIQPDPTQTLASVLQRMQEIKADFTQNDLEQLLRQQALVPAANTYFIYPTYTSPDNSQPTIKITALTAQTRKTLPKWLKIAAANEGQTKTVMTKEPVQDDPNYDWEKVFGNKFQAGKHWTEVGGNIDWTPGTGFNQTLGRIAVIHTTRCFFTADPAP